MPAIRLLQPQKQAQKQRFPVPFRPRQEKTVIRTDLPVDILQNLTAGYRFADMSPALTALTAPVRSNKPPSSEDRKSLWLAAPLAAHLSG